MSSAVILIVASIFIGSVIGGGTNRLAIAMLFRPHREVRIGRWTLPFTPGLIPKRRSELAHQLGRTVREYLVNGEALNRTIRHPEFQEELVEWAKKEWHHARNERRLRTWIMTLIEREETERQLQGAMRIGDWFSEEAKQELKRWITGYAPTVNQGLIRYLADQKGADTLRQLFVEWTHKRGWIRRLTGTLIDDAKIAEASRTWLIQMLASPQGMDVTRTLLEEGVNALLEWRLRDALAWAERETEGSFPVWDESVESLIERLVPPLLDRLAFRGEEWLDVLRLDQLVAEQIETFSLAEVAVWPKDTLKTKERAKILIPIPSPNIFSVVLGNKGVIFPIRNVHKVHPAYHVRKESRRHYSMRLH